MTQTATGGKFELPVWAAILLVTWGAAAAFNSGEFIMGGPPSARGILATLVVTLAWPAAGWFAGSRPGSGFARLAAAFWLTVVAGIPLVFGALILGLRLTVSQGGGLLLLLGFVLAAPLYGIAALLPSWGSFEYWTLLWAVVLAAATYVLTLGTYLLRRRLGQVTSLAASEAQQRGLTSASTRTARPVR